MNAAHIEQLDRRQYLEDADWQRVWQEYQLVAVEDEAESWKAALSSHSEHKKTTSRSRRAEPHHPANRRLEPEMLLCKWSHKTRRSDVHHWWVRKHHLDRDCPDKYTSFLQYKRATQPHTMEVNTKSILLTSAPPKADATPSGEAASVCQGPACACTKFVPCHGIHLGIEYAHTCDQCSDCDHVARQHSDWRAAIAKKKAAKARARPYDKTAESGAAQQMDVEGYHKTTESQVAKQTNVDGFHTTIEGYHKIMESELAQQMDVDGTDHKVKQMVADGAAKHMDVDTVDHPQATETGVDKVDPQQATETVAVQQMDVDQAYRPLTAGATDPKATADDESDGKVKDTTETKAPDQLETSDGATPPGVTPPTECKRVCHYVRGKRQCGCHKYVHSKVGPSCQRCHHGQHLHDDGDDADSDVDPDTHTNAPMVSPDSSDDDDDDNDGEKDNSRSSTVITAEDRADTLASCEALYQTLLEYRRRRDTGVGFRVVSRDPHTDLFECEFALEPMPPPEKATRRKGKSKTGTRTHTRTGAGKRSRTRRGAAVPRVCHAIDEVPREWIQEKFPEELAAWDGLATALAVDVHGQQCDMDTRKDARQGSRLRRRRRELDDLREGEASMARQPREKSIEEVIRTMHCPRPQVKPTVHVAVVQQRPPPEDAVIAGAETTAETKTETKTGSDVSPADVEMTPEGIAHGISQLSVSGSPASAALAPGEAMSCTFEDLRRQKPPCNIAGDAYVKQLAAVCKLDKIVNVRSGDQTYIGDTWQPDTLRWHLLAFGVAEAKIARLTAQGIEALLHEARNGNASNGTTYGCVFQNRTGQDDELVLRVPRHVLLQHFPTALAQFGFDGFDAPAPVTKRRQPQRAKQTHRRRKDAWEAAATKKKKHKA